MEIDYLAALATTDLAYSVILDHTLAEKERSMSTRDRGRAGYVPRPHAPTPHASTKLVRSSTQSTHGPHASIKSVRSSTLHQFISESVHEVTSQVSHSDTSSTHCNTDGTSKGKRGCGKSRSLKLAKLKNQGVRLPIQICKDSGRPYGEASEKFTSELGIVTRQFAPQNVPSWSDISEEDKETLVAYLQEGFKFTNEPYAIESILNLMHDRYKSYSHDLRQRFRSFPTMESALADPPENMEKETWKFLCEKWSDKDYKVRCGKNKLNREKLKVLHTAGSKAFRKVQYDETVPLERNLDLLSCTKRRILVRKKRHGCILMLRLDITSLKSGRRKLLKKDLARYLMSNFLLRYLDKKLATYEAEGVVGNQVQHYLENLPVLNSRGIMRLLQWRLKSNEESMRSWWEEFKSWSLIARNTMPKSTS
ncbi:unnamed protein product [Camellia sinensis]